jgi:L-iditol 2-dehydrogenase
MKAARYDAPGQIRLVDAPEPRAGPGELTLRVRNCSVCGTDLKIYRHGHSRIRPPRVLGHEIAGEVAELGSQVSGWTVGERVQLVGAIPCGTCFDCRHDRPTVCPATEAMGYSYDGGFAEYVRVPAKVLAVGGLNRIPAGVGFAEASMAEPLACVLNGQQLARVGAGDEVVVVGAGPIGCLHVRVARDRGAARVLLVDLDRQRLRRAAALVDPDEAICAEDGDVIEQVRRLTKGRGADVAILAVADPQAQRDALRYAAGRGRISLFGSLPVGAAENPLDANLVHYRELTLVGANASSPAQNALALELVAAGSVPVADLITHRLPLHRFDEALRILERGAAVKVTIEP